MKRKALFGLITLAVVLGAYPTIRHSRLGSCFAYAVGGFRNVSTERQVAFSARSRKTQRAAAAAKPRSPGAKRRGSTGRVTGQAADAASRRTGWLSKLGFLSPNRRGINGALLDLEYQRIELLKFNLFDNSGTYENYLRSRESHADKLIKIWPQFRLPQNNPAYTAVGAGSAQKCTDELVRFRTLTGICNDILNPLMGSVDQSFGRTWNSKLYFRS